jgi:hypothetical protein
MFYRKLLKLTDSFWKQVWWRHGQNNINLSDNEDFATTEGLVVISVMQVP